MPMIEVPAYTQALVTAATGTATGSLQVTSSAGFYAGCEAYLTDITGTRNVRCIIVSIPDATHVVVRIVADDNENQLGVQIYGAGSNLTAYTLANGTKLSMPSQLARVEFNTTAPSSLNK